jgi:hypothetical protein
MVDRYPSDFQISRSWMYPNSNPETIHPCNNWNLLSNQNKEQNERRHVQWICSYSSRSWLYQFSSKSDADRIRRRRVKKFQFIYEVAVIKKQVTGDKIKITICVYSMLLFQRTSPSNSRSKWTPVGSKRMTMWVADRTIGKSKQHIRRVCFYYYRP